MAQTELTFAYESLLKKTRYVQINPSIQGQISETVAILIGKDLQDKLDIVRKFVKFYVL